MQERLHLLVWCCIWPALQIKHGWYRHWISCKLHAWRYWYALLILTSKITHVASKVVSLPFSLLKQIVYQHCVSWLSTEGIALDWVSNNLYWTESITGNLEVLDLDVFERAVVLNTGANSIPRGMAVDPATRYKTQVDTCEAIEGCSPSPLKLC